MNCKTTKEKIDQLVFEQNKELLIEVEQHSKNCDNCASYFKDSHANAQLLQLLRESEPVLENPIELTNSILSRVEKIDRQSPTDSIQESRKASLLPLFVRILAAASVCLLLVFGVEQYTVVKKISYLETTVNSASGISLSSSMYATQSPVFILADASGINSRLINLMLKRDNDNLLRQALTDQAEQITEKTNFQQQTTFLNSKLYKLIGN